MYKILIFFSLIIPSTLLAESVANEIRTALELIDRGGKYEGKKTYNELLLKAAQLKHMEMIPELIKRGADVNAMTKDGRTALAMAVAGDSLETVMFLVEKANANPNLGSPGNRPLEVARRLKRKLIEPLLLNAGAK